MEFILAWRPSSCSFLHYVSVNHQRKGGFIHPIAVNPWTSPFDQGCTGHLSGFHLETDVRCRSLEPRSRSWRHGLIVSDMRNVCSQTWKSLPPTDGSRRLVEMRSCHMVCQRMKWSNGRTTKDRGCQLCSELPGFNVQFPFRTSGTLRSQQLDAHSILSLQNVRSSNVFIRRSRKASVYIIPTSSVRRDCSFVEAKGSVDTAGLRSFSSSSSLFNILWQKRRSPFVCYADNGVSGDPNELPAPTEKSLGDGARSSSSRLERWTTYLKQVDWMNFIFRWEKDEPLWNVPWTGQTIFQVMVLWFAAFWVMGSWIIPIAAQLAGFSRHSLSFRGQALYSLITDIAEGTVGIWILRRCLARFVPLPDGWFPINFKGKWLFEACWGCLLFPLVNKLSQLNLFLLPLPAPLASSYVEQSMMSRDPVATFLYAVVISICAPVWEEVIFRGFLLPSMTRYLPLWGAISVSALAFALAHFSMQRILPLTFLGLVMGFVFVRSRNLLASIVLHSLWNGFAFLELL